MQNQSSLLSPGRRLIGNLPFGKKFILVGAVFLVPILILLWASYQKLNGDIGFAEKERLGLLVIQPARVFEQSVQSHRGRSQLVLAGQQDASAALAEARQAADEALVNWAAANSAVAGELQTAGPFAELKGKWESAKAQALTLAPEQSFTAHGEVIDGVLAYIGLVADNSNLTLDPDLDSYYVMDTVTVRAPAIAEVAGKLRARAAAAAARGSLGLDDRIQIVVLMRLLDDSIQAANDGLGKATKANPDLQAVLFAPAKKLVDKYATFKASLSSGLLDSKQPALEADTLFAQGTEVVDAAYGIFDPALPALDKLLEARIKRLQGELIRDLLVAGLSLLVAMYLFASLRSSLVSQVEEIRRGASRIADGRFDESVSAYSADELGQIATAVDHLRVQLNESIEAERRIAEENLRVRVALDNVSTAVMIADNERKIIYLNRSAEQMMRENEQSFREHLPSFSAATLIGSNIDLFHKNPAHQAGMLATFTKNVTATMELGDRHMVVSASPVISNNGERLGAVAEWRDRTDEVLAEREIGEIVNQAAVGDFTRRLSLEGKEGFFRALAEGLNLLLETSAKGLNDVAQVLNALAQGDLTRTIDGDYQGTFGQLRDDTNTTVERLKEVVGRIQEATQAINTAAQEIAAGNQDLSSRTEEQASSLEETASSMEQLNATVKQNAENARQANELAKASNDGVVKGGAVVKQVVITMSDIQQSSRKIADIIGVIDSIAFQTNILALNAAVEAARAGEQGRGFAVVATEVRSLAQRSATAAKEIKELIAASVGKVEDGAKLVAEAGTTMDEVVKSFQQVAALVTEISSASREQSSGIDQVTLAVSQMDEVTQQNAALVEQAAAAAESLEEQAKGLVHTVAMFKTGSGPRLPSFDRPPRLPANKPAHRPALNAPSRLQDPDDEWSEF